jgi:hypothetical protein
MPIFPASSVTVRGAADEAVLNKLPYFLNPLSQGIFKYRICKRDKELQILNDCDDFTILAVRFKTVLVKFSFFSICEIMLML